MSRMDSSTKLSEFVCAFNSKNSMGSKENHVNSSDCKKTVVVAKSSNSNSDDGVWSVYDGVKSVNPVNLKKKKQCQKVVLHASPKHKAQRQWEIKTIQTVKATKQVASARRKKGCGGSGVSKKAKHIKKNLSQKILDEKKERGEARAEKESLLVEGAFVYHWSFKLGRIKKVDGPNLYIRFLAEKGLHRMSISLAKDALEVLPNSHIRVLKACAMDKLKERVLEDPIWTFKALTRSYNGSVTLAEVRQELEGSVLKKNYFDWIQRAIEAVNKDPHFIQVVKNGRVAFAYTEDLVYDDDKTIVDLPIIPPQCSIYIRQHNYGCIAKRHKLKPFYTYIPVRSGNGIKTIKVYVDYCTSCRRFFISDLEFSSKFGTCTECLLRCFISPNGLFYGPRPELNGALSQESALKQAGYTVSKQESLSPHVRQQILDEVILYGIMDVATVKSYLQFFISYQGRNSGMEDAVDNWMLDLGYINRKYSKPLEFYF